MKKYILTALASFAIIQGVYSQTETEKIANIEKATKETQNNLGKYLKDEQVKDSTGNRYVYKEGNELKLITVYYRDTDANKNVEWYFSNGEFIYTQTIWTDKTTNKVINSEKCYLKDGQLIAWINNDKLLDTTSLDFKSTEAALLAYGKKLIAAEK
jgi:hypothetical protein